MERIDINTYITEIQYDNISAGTVMRRLCQAFRDGDVAPNEDTTLKELYGIFSYMCQYVTKEELTRLVSPVFSAAGSASKLSHMVSEKRLRKWQFAEGTEFNSRCAFSPTASTCESFAPFFYAQTARPKMRRNNGKVPMHDFALGVNMLHLLNSPFSFSWSKEETLNGIYKVKASLSIDMLVMLNGPHEPRTNLFIEQDMCTEPISTLLAKIELYDRHDLAMGDFYILLFSIYSINGSRRKLGCFDKAFLRKVMSDMEEHSCYSLYNYFGFVKEHMLSYAESYLDRLSRLVVALNICDAPWETDIFRVNAGSRIIPCEDVSAADYSLEELDDLYADIESQCDCYTQAYENLEHWNAAYRRWKNTLNALIPFTFGSRVNERLASVLIMGYRCIYAPTVLLSNYFPYLFPYSYGTYKRYTDSLFPYYGAFSDVVHTTDLQSLIDDFPPFVFHNAASTVDNGMVVINLAWDIGAVFSAYVLLHNAGELSSGRAYLHFVFIVDNMVQMNTLNEYLGMSVPSNRFDGTLSKKPFNVSYLLSSDVGEPDKLWMGVLDQGKALCSRVHAGGISDTKNNISAKHASGPVGL